jgi:PAS domain S-box-containing protein
MNAAQQEQVRRTLITDLQWTEDALPTALDIEVERRVEERTSELAVVNEKLRREIVERKQAEEALKESESRLAGILSSMLDLVFAFDSDGKFTFHHSPHVGDLYVPPQEFIGKKHWEIMPPHLNEPFAEAFEKNRKGEAAQVEYWLEIGGRVRWFCAKLSPEFLEGEFTGSVSVVREITGHKRVEEALRKAHQEVERRVEKRTAELAMANEELKHEIEQRRQMEGELLRSREGMLRSHHLLLALSRAAQAVQRARTSEEVYRTIGDVVTGLGYHAMILALTDDREHLTLSHTTFEPAQLRRVEELSGLSVLDFRFPLAPNEFSQRAITEGESAFCERTVGLLARSVPQLGSPLIERLVAMLGVERSIYAPLRISGETCGLFCVASTGLTEEDVPAVTAFANQAAIAIENARLLEQVGASHERLRRLTHQIVSAQEEERRRLSRALHDEAGQALTALRISLELIEEDLPVEFGLLRQRIGDAAALTDVTMEQIRLLAQALRPPALDAVGLNPTLEGFCRDFSERTQLSINYLGLELPMLPEAVNTCLYRFLQEALTNVAKHACADRVCVALRCDAEMVCLSVEDDGRGFDKEARLSVSGWPMGIGLLGMQERLESLGGRLEIQSQPDQGTYLVAHLPAEGYP